MIFISIYVQFSYLLLFLFLVYYLWKLQIMHDVHDGFLCYEFFVYAGVDTTFSVAGLYGLFTDPGSGILCYELPLFKPKKVIQQICSAFCLIIDE